MMFEMAIVFKKGAPLSEIKKVINKIHQKSLDEVNSIVPSRVRLTDDQIIMVIQEPHFYPIDHNMLKNSDVVDMIVDGSEIDDMFDITY